MARRSRYSPEVKERAVRMVFDQQHQHESQWAAIGSVASKIGCTSETLLGQHGNAQGHLRNQGVGVGDLFPFWGSFRAVDDELRWVRKAEHYIWGWLQIRAVVSVDKVVRNGGKKWRWAEAHPHFAFPRDSTNTLYVAAKRLSLPGEGLAATPGSGVFERVDKAKRAREGAPVCANRELAALKAMITGSPG